MPGHERTDLDRLRRNRFRAEDVRLDDFRLDDISVGSVEEDVRASMEDSVRARLNLRGDLPPEMAEAIRTTAATAAASTVQLTVADAAVEATRDVGRGSLTQRFDSKISLAAASLEHIGQSSEVDQVLRRRSELLAKKRDSLVAAGFSAEEAMQILLADIAARAH